MIGFDYGTSNCAVAVMEDNKPRLISLANHGRYMPSSLYAPSRDMIVNWLESQLAGDAKLNFIKERQQQITKGQSALRELAFDGIDTNLDFGQAALSRYLEDPEEGYYIKSPKSFLGASGLHPQQIALFEDIIASMMIHVKQATELSLQREVTQTVIGRPINFQGLRGEESNQQALTILTNAATRAGFKDVEYQYEPVAAGFEFEATLAKESRVLVVDIGGGTTDISMLLMGPQHAQSVNREQDLLGHSGQRIGGNDLDIQLTMRGLMPSLGLDTLSTSGKPMPTSFHWQAASINNINDQTDFYSPANERALKELIKQAAEPELVTRLLQVQQEKLSYQLVNSAEKAKIALTDHSQHQVDLNYLSNALYADVSRDTLRLANRRHLDSIGKLIDQTIEQAGCQPDVIFITGGSAKSPVLHDFLEQHLQGVPVATGDHFASVTSGLSRWADKIFK
ncbi:molecular chaperone [Psychrobium sp. 1_MG-2023]|uniref:molecular chaperone n=1 Tax=Psychrobium sp. 1_MG-2023 TaxID=3062624 RepID=UPI000C3353AC|nr:molecular chaperone [Psychrobium sp. 1_MG-2023]MDP2561655.1 molecular chaperone [Psychrobium sp. 1_MG-2023]PKF55671.1 molecular chaperone [Alteromonadales bacterium alter-6D02]